MSIIITKQDITKIECDAIVEITDELELGKMEITEVCDLPYKHIIRTATNYRLRMFSCRSLIRFVLDKGYESIAIPLAFFGDGEIYNLSRAIRTIEREMSFFDIEVKIVIGDKDSYRCDCMHLEKIISYLTEHGEKSLRETARSKYKERIEKLEECIPQKDQSLEVCDDCVQTPEKKDIDIPNMSVYHNKMEVCSRPIICEKAKVCRRIDDSIFDKLQSMDKGFSELLFMLIDQKGISDVECYKRANIGRKTFSKIKCNKDYRPSKATALSFAIALELNLKETNALLQTLGMTLSNSIEFDVIVQYFIEKEIYNIHTINEMLFEFDQVLLGS